MFSYQAPKLITKPTTFDKLESKPLSELTNKIGHHKNSKSMNKMKIDHPDANAQ